MKHEERINKLKEEIAILDAEEHAMYADNIFTDEEKARLRVLQPERKALREELEKLEADVA